MKKPKTAVLDGDILVYKAAFWADMEGIDELPDRLKYDVKKWTPKGCKPVLAFSCPRSQNFRRRFWPDYKAHRDDTMQPDSKDYAVEIIVDGFDVVEYPQLEADDIMGIEASAGDAIAVTIDKDLRCVPGWHWNPSREKKPVFVSEEDADFFFYTQWMTGDATDNIPGLWKIGPKKAEKFLRDTDKENWVKEILELYRTEERPEHKGRCGLDPIQFGRAMAWCVRILRHGEYDKSSQLIQLWKHGYKGDQHAIQMF
jgi:hypothetical protein